MKINAAGTVNANLQTTYGIGQGADSYSKNIQNQIADAQKALQELSSNENLTMEEKRQKRQEIQQEIADLNQQLRQHQETKEKTADEGLLCRRSAWRGKSDTEKICGCPGNIRRKYAGNYFCRCCYGTGAGAVTGEKQP